VFPDSVSSNELGEAITRALNVSREGVPHPLDWKSLALPRLAAAGVKSEATFQKKAELVTIYFDGTALTITPHRNGGGTGDEKGFHPIFEREAHSAGMTFAEIGAAAFQAFEHCN
jgi:hypothetical protein